MKYYWHGENARRQPHRVWPPGEDLAVLRRGLGREPGSVPQMCRFYTTLTEDGRLTPALQAEHAALALFAVHQQSSIQRMHRTDVGLGAAARELRRSGKFSEEAVDRRFTAAATATSMIELTLHLRGLVAQLRQIGQPLDYDRLVDDLIGWQDSDRVGKVRRHWGAQYFVRTKESDTVNSSSADPETPSTGASA